MSWFLLKIARDPRVNAGERRPLPGHVAVGGWKWLGMECFHSPQIRLSQVLFLNE